ncbi:polysaccharide deacetylase family protein [uncultured Desulfovibrio sp.]|uniref:polysaccharide deacetylase family protein n=1 Tax=uncultured Desulfovibrio sp. TaxID=167968 RepID=UPI002611D149|nr:polysaccharide deacetylase family protein [uncultured Desulfovibrio sp.]
MAGCARWAMALGIPAGILSVIMGVFPAWAAPQAAESHAAAAPGLRWEADALDARRALPNDARPPVRRAPTVQLAPLGPDMVGNIRRVTLSDGEKAAALTFDLCELATVTTGCDMAVLNFLREERIPATLFMGGKWMRTHARRVRQIMAEPLFEIGNHAWTHGNCALLAPQGLRAQVLWTQAQYELLREEVLRDAENRGLPAPAVAPVPVLFRLPYGRCNDAALAELARLGLRVVQWDVAAESGDSSNPAQAKKTARIVAAQVRPGSILLFHANGVPAGTAQLLREVTALLRAQGYRFVTAGELLRMGTPQMSRDGYFSRPGDNLALDSRFGVDGTGLRAPFTGD